MSELIFGQKTRRCEVTFLQSPVPIDSIDMPT